MNLNAKFYLVLCENGEMQVSTAVRIAFLPCSDIDYISFRCSLLVTFYLENGQNILELLTNLKEYFIHPYYKTKLQVCF